MKKLNIRKTLEKAIKFHNNKDLKKAELLYKSILNQEPNQANANHNMGVLMVQLNNPQNAIRFFENALKNSPENKQYQQSYNNIKSILNNYNSNAQPEEKLIIFFNQGNFKTAIDLGEKLIRENPSNLNILRILGMSHALLKNFSDAIKYFLKVIKLDKENPENYFNLATAYKDSKKWEKAENNYKKSINLKSDYFEAYVNYGNVLKEQNKLNEAIIIYEKAISINPHFPILYFNKANILKELDNLKEAEKYYLKAIELDKNYSEAYCNLGSLYMKREELELAEKKFLETLNLNANHYEAYFNLGIIYYELKRFKLSIVNLEKALSFNENFSEAYYYIGLVLQENNNPNESKKYFLKAISIKNDYYLAIIAYLIVANTFCFWENDYFKYKEIVYNTTLNNIYSIQPLGAMYFYDSLKLNKSASVNFAKYNKYTLETENRKIDKYNNLKIKIAYFSPDFNAHPIYDVFNKILKSHDLNKFEIHIFYLHPKKFDANTSDIKNSVFKFHNVSHLKDNKIAELSRKEKIDIAINLSGYTEFERTNIFSNRAAPIQINYLGYPGTMGVDFMDFIIADKNIIPNESKEFYSENLINLPNCFFPTNDSALISDTIPSKKELEIPEDKFVFASFSNSSKITPEIFDTWIKLLLKVENSVLWLSINKKITKENLLKVVEDNNIDINRIIFTKFIKDKKDHFARIKQADLFLDTYPYGSHTTASDILYSGVPIITLQGETFASRVCSSMLKTLDVNELITTSLKEYQNLAINLANDKKTLKNIRSKIEKNKKTSTLFNTKLYTQNLEKAYIKIFENYKNNIIEDIEV